jgi:FMN phosphatase YigB (HAD superfamily)
MLSAIRTAWNTSFRPSSGPKTILLTFDGLGTLYTFKAPVAQQYIAIAKQHGFKGHINESQLALAFKSEYARMQQLYPNYGKGQLESPRAWWNQVTQRSFQAVVGDESSLGLGLYDALYTHFESAQAYKLYPDVGRLIDILRRLRADPSSPDIIVGVITNSDPRVSKVLRSLGLKVCRADQQSFAPAPFSQPQSIEEGMHDYARFMDHFRALFNQADDISFVVTSYETGAAKPDAQIFSAAASCATASATARVLQKTLPAQDPSLRELINSQMGVMWRVAWSEKLHVGDDFDADYKGAEEAEWRAFHLVRDGEGKRVEGANTVSSLAEVGMALNLMVQQQKKE